MIGRGRNLSHARNEIHLHVRGHAGVRLDRYLRENLAWRSRTRIQRLIREGHVTVNGREVKPSWVVRSGDRIEVRLSLGTGMPDYEAVRIPVLYEDPWLVALGKPPGWLVHPVGRHVYDTVINYLHHHYREAMGPGGEVHPRLCHRIDRDTTGVLLVGKDRFVHLHVTAQLERRQVFKEYVALVEGHVPDSFEQVDLPLREGRDLEEALHGTGLKPSTTRFRVIERLDHDGRPLTWIAARPITGRQNQIRVHLAAAGHPLLGDTRYGGAAPPDELPFPQRFLLHSREIRFYHPRLKTMARVRAPLPDDVAALLIRLRGGAIDQAARAE